MSLEKIKEEERELEKLMYPQAEEENPSEEVPEAPSPEEAPATIEATESEPQKAPKRNDWKKRYSTYKSTTDNTIFQLRRENTELRDSLLRLEDKVTALGASKPRDVYEGVITQDDEDLIGTEAVEVLKKTTEAVTNPLKKELMALKAERREAELNRIKRERASSQNDLRSKLSGMIDNFEAIDMSKGFGTYLSEVDSYSGHTRKHLYSLAVTNGDLFRVAEFYNEYAKTLPPTKDSILEGKIAPVGDNKTTTNTQGVGKITYSINEYNKTYNDYVKGAWKNQKEKKQLIDKMDLLDLAFVEGRIV